MHKTILTVMLVCAVSLSSHQVTAQDDGHIHDAHPTTKHSAAWYATGWYRITPLMAGPTSPVVVAGPETWVVLVNHNETNSHCETVKASVDVTKEVTHEVNVGGKITVGGSVEYAAGALFAKCKATAEASVEFNGSYSDSETESVKISSSTSIPPCQKVNYTFKKKKKTASGEISTYDHKFTCRYGNSGRTETLFCNPTKLEGSAVGWGETDGQWTKLGKLKPCPCDEEKPSRVGGEEGKQVASDKEEGA